MIFITATFPVKPEHADDWPALTKEYTDACNAEEGCLLFRWSRSLDDPCDYVLLEAYADDEAGAAHVATEHFTKATQQLPAYLRRTPQIVNVTVDGWSELEEMAVTS